MQNKRRSLWLLRQLCYYDSMFQVRGVTVMARGFRRVTRDPVPVCAWCGRVRMINGKYERRWYNSRKASHGICEDCQKECK